VDLLLPYEGKKSLNIQLFNGIRAPESYTDQRYYSQICYRFEAKDKKIRYARYRVIPFDPVPETGLLSFEDQLNIVDLQDTRAKEETRDKEYLRNEFRERVKTKVSVQLCERRNSDLLYNL
jgi:hypothetical protein